MNNDDMSYLYGNGSSEEFYEETTTTFEEVLVESSEEIVEETTTTSEEVLVESSEEIVEEETAVLVTDNSEIVVLLEEQNTLLSSTYDIQVFIFIVLLFILFRTYVLHIFDMIRSFGKD